MGQDRRLARGGLGFASLMTRQRQMCKKNTRRAPNRRLEAISSGSYPVTQQNVLLDAARGLWEPFVERYLRPCWHELSIVCRQRGIPLPDAEDLFQEFLVRAMQEGRFGNRVRALLREAGEPSGFRGNLAAKYLKYRSLPVPAVRFRTFLQSVIRNLVREAARRRRREGPRLLEDQLEQIQPCIEESVSRFIDEQWLLDRLRLAAQRLKEESDAARTRGQRRLFQVLCLSAADGVSEEAMARTFGVHRTTIASSLTRSRARFVALMEELIGSENLDELRTLAARHPTALAEALRAARSGD